MTRRLLLLAGVLLILSGATLYVLRDAGLRYDLKSALGFEPPPAITPLPTNRQVASGPTRTRAPIKPIPTAMLPSPTVARTATTQANRPTVPPTITLSPAPPTVPPSPTPVKRNGRVYDAYIDAAIKEGQAYQYSCEFDAAWVVLQTFGIDADVETIINNTPIDRSVEPQYEETAEGFVIHGGDIFNAYSGDYGHNFLARSTGSVFVPIFTSYGLRAELVRNRAGIEATLRSGGLVWMKTTVDFKPWRPATWITPDGRTHRTVLGNDHAVVVIGFNKDVVVIRDVLGPTSTGRNRPLEYEVDWNTFLRSWGAQDNDGVAVFGR